MLRKVTYIFISGWLAASAVSAVSAQGQGGPGVFGGFRGQQGAGGFGGFQRGQRGLGPGGAGGAFGPGGGMMGRGGIMGLMGGQDRNPLVSHAFELVHRPDVQSELNLDLRQKNALVQYESQIPDIARQQMQSQMQAMRQNGFGRNPNGPGAQPGGNNGGGDTSSPQDAAAQRQQMQQQRQQQMLQMRTDIQNKINTGLNDILTPAQLARLRQLDLQWRTALSIADPSVATEIHVTAEHRTAINGLVTEYQQKQNEARQQLMATMRADRQAAANGTQTNNVRPDPAIAMERADTAARKEYDEKAVKLLAAEEKDQWTKAIGKLFTFRADIRSSGR